MSSGEHESWEGRTLASQFEIQEELGRGGMGVVYSARQLGMDRTVVIKVMHAELSANATAVERFRREAQSVGKLNHPNIVQVHMFGQAEDGSLYIAMEYVDGRSLSQDQRIHGAMHEARALKIVDQILSALIEAHGVGIIHRDLKPDNVMLTSRQGSNDYVKVLDFGLAKVFGDVQHDDTITQAGMVTGTPRYMSPEQARGLKLDARTDIYSLGIVLYEMLTGKHPFDAESALDFMHKHTTEEVPSPRARVKGLQLAPKTEQLLMKALTKKPDQRFQSAREMQRAVRAVLRDFPEAVRVSPTPASSQLQSAPTIGATTAIRRTERRRLVTAVTVLAVATLVLIVAMLVVFSQASRKGSEADVKPSETVAQKSLPSPSADDEASRPAPPDTAVEQVPVPPAESLRTPDVTVPDRPAVDPVDEAALRAEIEAAVEAELARGKIGAGGGGADVALVPPVMEHVQPAVEAGADAGAVVDVVREEPEQPPVKVDRQALSKMAFAGLNPTKDAELVARTAQVCTYATAQEPAQVIESYRAWLDKSKCKVRAAGNTLLGQDDACPYRTINVVNDGSMTTKNPHLVSIVFREGMAPPLDVGTTGPFGEPLPEGAVPATLTPHAIIYDVKAPVEDVVPFYTKRYQDKRGLMITRNRVMGADQLVIFAQDGNYPFMTITVMKSFTARGMTQITITSRDMMESYGAGI